MTVSQLRKEIREFKEAAVKIPNFLMYIPLKENEELQLRADVKNEIGELRDKIKFYCDAGLFDESDHSVKLNFDLNQVDNISINLIHQWKNRHNLRLGEGMQLFRDIGFFN